MIIDYQLYIIDYVLQFRVDNIATTVAVERKRILPSHISQLFASCHRVYIPEKPGFNKFYISRLAASTLCIYVTLTGIISILSMYE
jgi:hypothetical protein